MDNIALGQHSGRDDKNIIFVFFGYNFSILFCAQDKEMKLCRPYVWHWPLAC